MTRNRRPTVFDSLQNYCVADLAAKIRWRMRFDRQPLYTTLQDKFLVRGYAEQRGVGMADLLHVTDDPSTIPFDTLAPEFMIKATHGCGWNILGHKGRLSVFGDGSAGEDSLLTPAEAIAMCRGWLDAAHAPREWAYRAIRPRIIVERLLSPRAGGELMDYRFYTFDGVVKAINVGSPGYRRDHLNAFYTPAWDLIPLSRYAETLPDPLPARPETLAEMIDAAERLGKGISFVRIDLYDTADGVRLGELTVYPQGGTRRSPTGCRSFNTWLGRQWRTTPLQTAAAIALNVSDIVPDALRSLRHRWRRRISGEMIPDVDWEEWHRRYDEFPAMQLRLAAVQAQITQSLDHLPAGPVRLASICAGDGRDVIGALQHHPRRRDVRGVLVEIDERLVKQGQSRIEAAGLSQQLCYRHADATRVGTYDGITPAELIVAAGVLGNLTPRNTVRFIAALRSWCTRDAAVIWTRNRVVSDGERQLPLIMRHWKDHGFVSDCLEKQPDHVVGTHRYAGDTRALPAEDPLFIFTGFANIKNHALGFRIPSWSRPWR